VAISRGNVGAVSQTGISTTISAAISGGSVAGNLIVVIARSSSALATGVTDSLGTTYGSAKISISVGDPYLTVFSAVAPSTGANTVEVTYASEQAYRWLYVIEYASSVAGTWAYETGATGRTSSTTDMATSAISTAGAGVLVAGATQATTGCTYSAGSSFTLLSTAIGGGTYGGTEEYITSGALSSFTAHITSSTTAIGSIIVGAWKHTADATTPPVSLLLTRSLGLNPFGL
jgi:hypothetical protein